MSKRIETLAWIGSRIGKPPGWERIVRRLAPPEKCRSIPEICVVRDGCLVVVQPSIPLGWHVIFFGTYEPELREIFRAVLPSEGVALDIGANIGWHTLLMARLVGARGRVLAAEANSSVREQLLANLNLNRFSQVEVIPFAISDSEGTVEFYGPAADDADSGNGYMVPDSAATKPRSGIIRLETRRVDAIVAAAQLERLDLIKIDVEGFEWPVLRGGEETIAKFRPQIVFEYNAEYASRGGGSPAVVFEFFQRYRYRLFTIRRTWAEAVRLDHWPNSADIWAIPLK